MSIIIDSVSIVGLRRVHFEQLLSIIRNHNDTEDYYGNKSQHRRRNVELAAWVNDIIYQVSQDGVKIPRRNNGQL